MAVVLGALASAALAIQVEQTSLKLNGGQADFGNGTHSFGSPDSPGLVRWDYTVNQFGSLVATARVTGRLYLDSLDPGQVRLTIQFRDQFGNTFADGTRVLNLAGPGGNANLAANQLSLDESYSSVSVYFAVLTTRVVLPGGGVTGGTTGFSSAPGTKTYKLKINSGTADFGSGSHAFGAPTGDATVRFNRNNQILNAQVIGTLYWDSLFSAGTPRIIIDRQTAAGTTITTVSAQQNCPGGDANKTANKRAIDSSSGLDSPWQIRLRVGSQVGTSFVNVTTRIIRFESGVSNGTFELTPDDVFVAAHERLNYAFTWTVPEPLNWHDLDFLQFRIRDGSATLISVHFDEETQTFALLDEETGEIGHAYPAGSARRLQTPDATLFLAQTSVQGSGPTGPSVTLNLSLSFKPHIEGRWLAVEVAATDDAGAQGGFELAGAVTGE